MTTISPKPSGTRPPAVTPGDVIKPPTIKDLNTGRQRGNITDLSIQEAAINAACEFMGSDLWYYGIGSGRKYKRRAELLQATREACGWALLSYKTLMRWIDHYQKYGEAPAKSRRNAQRSSIKKLRSMKAKYFVESDEQALKEIVDNQPQLYLDEIALELQLMTGKKWSSGTLWRKLHTLGYSLKTAVFRAKQQNLDEVNEYFGRITDRLKHPRQLIYIDETARGANAARRRRAWSPRGVTPIIDAPMVREFDKRYTLIAACNWDGFVPSACQIVEREQGKNDDNPDRGTVDTARFEKYIEEYLVPVLGNYALDEPHSIVVMDNASIHNSENIRQLIEDAGALLVFTAPYSPEYNPIEYMFGEYKKSLKRHSHQEGYDWHAVHLQALNVVTPSMAKNFFRHCQVPLMDWWFEQEGNKLEGDNDFLPFPFNDIYEYIMDNIS